MRTLTQLYSLEGKVYLFINSEQAYEVFTKKATEEGFTLPKVTDDILALNPDFSFSHPGLVGHMKFHNDKHGLIRIDFIKWIGGANNYLYQE